MARTSRLADVEFAKRVATLYLEGLTREEIRDSLPYEDGTFPHIDTISLWVHDPRVQVHIDAGARARTARITRRIDREIEARITGAGIGQIDLETLLRIRKELKGKVPEGSDQGAEGATSDIWDALDANPDLLDQVSAAMKKPDGAS